MHLENIYCQQTKSKDTKQRDRYTQLIAFIQESTFEAAMRNTNKYLSPIPAPRILVSLILKWRSV